MVRQGSGGKPVVDEAKATAAATPTLVVGPYPSSRRSASLAVSRPLEARLEEAAGLAHAIDLDVREVISVNLGDIRPATYLGKGKVDELAARVNDEKIKLVSMDCALSPVQQRNWSERGTARSSTAPDLFSKYLGDAHAQRKGRCRSSWLI